MEYRSRKALLQTLLTWMPIRHAPRLQTLISESSTVTNSSCTLLNCWREPTKRNFIFVSFILSRLVTIQALTCVIQQSQSKLLGRFAVFLPFQCWCARFGDLTAIKNIGRARRRARSRNSVVWKGPNYFCLRLKVGLLWAHYVEEMSTMAWRKNTAGYHLHTYGY